jgi:hypothetical protein
LNIEQDYAPHTRVQLWAFADSLKPRRVVKTNDVSGETESGHLLADYSYDRLTIRRTTGAVEASHRLRALPYSFDEFELPLVVRQLRFNKVEWPFESAISQPELAKNAPLSIAKPERVDVLAADGVTYACYELKLLCGTRKPVFWVQRTAPYRIVRMEDAGVVWTLSDFMQAD